MNITIDESVLDKLLSVATAQQNLAPNATLYRAIKASNLAKGEAWRREFAADAEVGEEIVFPSFLTGPQAE